MEEILSELREKMTKTSEALKKEYKRIRTGRASSALLDGIRVDCYDTQMPLEQLASISVPESRLTGHPTRRLCHHASFAFEGIEGESVVVDLDLAGFAASSGAACAEGEPEPSFVLEALGLAPEWSLGALRLTLGRANDETDVSRLVDVLPAIVSRIRAGD